MSSEHNDHPEHKDTYFEESTVAIGVLYTIFALAVVFAIYFFG